MRYIICTLLFLAIFSSFFVSCKTEGNGKKGDGNQKEKGDSLLSQWEYTNDSGEVAMMVFGEDGSCNYIVERPENIFHKTKSGIEYKIVKASKSKRSPKIGDVLYMDMSYRTEKTDSLIFTSKDLKEEFKMRLSAPSDKGCIEEALMLLREGDSAVIYVDAIKFFIKSQGQVSIPPFIKEGERLMFSIKLNKIVSAAEYINANKDSYVKRIEEENSLISRFLLNIGGNYPQKKTDSGLYILTINNGNGKIPKVGSTVKVDYTAAFIDGSVFDSTLERAEPFSFVTGKKQVIEGLDEAVMNMVVGDHCLVVIPFRLAYGDQKYGNIIPPFSTLVFEIELLDAK